MYVIMFCFHRHKRSGYSEQETTNHVPPTPGANLEPFDIYTTFLSSVSIASSCVTSRNLITAHATGVRPLLSFGLRSSSSRQVATALNRHGHSQLPTIAVTSPLLSYVMISTWLRASSNSTTVSLPYIAADVRDVL